MEALPNPPNVSTPPTMTKIFSSLPTTNSNKLAFQEKKLFNLKNLKGPFTLAAI
jgi:hypothetical protein